MLKVPGTFLMLAPMEGVTDWAMRDLLTSLGGVDLCVTEFLRVTDKLHPYSVFYRNCPELKTNSKTSSGTPVMVQLLGGQATALADNAARAAEMGAYGIDLNFGCPAKTVNRHDGGAVLLKATERIYKIVSDVRKSVPLNIPVSAKIRLGFDDPSLCIENSIAIEEAGANWLTVHCRTKTDGYKPPAYWEWIPKIKEKTTIPIVTNGEIWTEKDFQTCHQISQTNAYMIGRGAIRDPFIFQKIKEKVPGTFRQKKVPGTFSSFSLIIPFFEASSSYVNDHFAVARTKGWLKQLGFASPQIKEIFEEIKVFKKPDEFRNRLEYYFSQPQQFNPINQKGEYDESNR